MKNFIFVLFCVGLLVNDFVHAIRTHYFSVKSSEYPTSECHCTTRVCLHSDGISGLAKLKEDMLCDADYEGICHSEGTCHCEDYRCQLEAGVDHSTFKVTSRDGSVNCHCLKAGCTSEDGSLMSEVLTGTKTDRCDHRGPCKKDGYCICALTACERDR